MQYAEYIEWLTRLKLAAYGLTGMDANITSDVNRATAEQQALISSSRGVASYKQLIEEYFTRQIIWSLGEDFKWLEFKFDEHVTLEARKTLADIHKLYVDMGALTENEVREELGREPLDDILTTEDMPDDDREDDKQDTKKPKA